MSHRLRVLIFATHFAELAGRFALALSEFSDVCLVVDGKNYDDEWAQGLIAAAGNLQVVRQPIKNPRRVIPYLISALFKFRPDIIQFEETIHAVDSVAIGLARLYAPVVLRVHDPVTHSGNDSKLDWWITTFRKWHRNHIDLAMLHGEYCYDQFTSQYKSLAVNTVHGPISLPAAAQLREPDKGRFLMFGRMEAYKGLDVLCEALGILTARGLRPPVTIAGRGSELTRLVERLRRMPNVTITDKFLTPDEVVNVFQQAEFVVLPYRDASQSGVLAGALANGRVPLASRTGGITAMLTDGVNGLLVPPGDPKALAEAMARLLQDEGLVQRLRDHASSYFSDGWRPIVQDLLPYFETLRR